MLTSDDLDIPLLGLVMLAGSVLRVAPLVGGGFPLNDGGLFLSMAEDLLSHGFAIPVHASYNGLDLPYAYPPLAFYLTAVLEGLGISGLDVLRIAPLMASIATIPVVYLLGREIFRSSAMALGTAAFFAVSTGSYEWLVLGGGITRSPGFLLALIAVLLAIRAYRGRSGALAAGAGVALGGTALWHPQATVFAVLSVALLLPFVTADRRRALRSLGIVLATAALVCAPWLVVVLTRHGVDPFLSAVGTGGTPLLGIVNLLISRTSGGQFEVLGIATTLGLMISGIRGFWLAPAWVVAIVLVDSRAGQPYVAVPAAMAVTFMLRNLGSALAHAATPERGDRVVLARRAATLIGCMLFVAALGDSLAAQGTPDSPLRAVTAAERSAMAWMAEEADADATVVVVSGRYWALDAESEWFPVLAERRSLATVQGYEWLGGDAFARQRERAETLPRCVATADVACVERWFEDAGQVDYLFLTDSAIAHEAGLECCLQLAEQINGIRSTEVVHEDADVAIVRLSGVTGE